MSGPAGCPFCGSQAAPQRVANGLRCPACQRTRVEAPVTFTAAGAPRPRAFRRIVPARMVARRPAGAPRRRGIGAVGGLLLGAVAAVGVALIAYSLSQAPDDPLNLKGDPARPLATPPDADGFYHRDFKWSYGGSDWDFQMRIPAADYDRFHNAERPTRLVDKGGTLYRQMAYDVFVTTPLDDEYVQDIAAKLDQAASEKGWSDAQKLSFALSFVQSMPYTPDDVTTDKDEYPRYPLETLVDFGGDCEDSAILYASIVQAMGYGVVLVSPPGHMAVGVKAAAGIGGTSYNWPVGSPDHYLYAETTGDDWELGEAPEEYREKEAQIFDLEPRPLFSLKVDYGEIEGGMQEIRMHASAIGSAVAYEVDIVADLTAGSQSFDRKACHYATIAPGEKLTCTVQIDLRNVPRGQEVSVLAKVQDQDFWYARQDSAPWVPRP